MEPQQDYSFENCCEEVRQEIKKLKKGVALLLNHPEFDEGDQSLSEGNVPPSRNANAKSNLTLAFRGLEDSRMRMGKAMQAFQGGVSILDKEKNKE